MVVIDIDMPESCQDCRAYGTSACDKWDKHRTFSDQRTKRHKDCPIVGEIEQEPKMGYISIDDVMSVFDDFMCGEVDEDGTNTFLEMLKDKAESEEQWN